VPRRNIAIVGAETLIGRELRDLLAERSSDDDVELIAAAEQILTEDEEEAVIISPLTADRLEDADAILLAASNASSYKVLELAPPTAAIIDVTGGLEDHPDASISPRASSARTIRLVGHPAAIVMARVLLAVHDRLSLRHAVVHVFEPASERGQAGIHELQQQTTSLLSFRPLEKHVFDAQLSFNMLPRYGSAAPHALEETEQRIERHLVTLLDNRLAMPSLRLIQAPVFHGHSFSFWLWFEQSVEIDEITDALETVGVEVRTPDLDVPTNVGSAGQSGITAGLIEPDRNHARSVWMWAVADNLRVSADAAIDLLDEVAA
jgi:aspartate-semialdehyde dehydrogenase